MSKTDFAISLPGFGRITSREQFYRKIMGPRRKREKRARIVIAVFLLLVAAFVWVYYVEDTNKPSDIGFEVKSKQLCNQHGGVWKAWVLGGPEFCQVPARDAKTACTDGNDCTYGGCIFNEVTNAGECQTYHYTPDCVQYLINGILSDEVCN